MSSELHPKLEYQIKNGKQLAKCFIITQFSILLVIMKSISKFHYFSSQKWCLCSQNCSATRSCSWYCFQVQKYSLNWCQCSFWWQKCEVVRTKKKVIGEDVFDWCN